MTIHKINLVVGDWSDDGHGKTHTESIRSNLSKQEIEDAYERGIFKLDERSITDYCKEYESSSAPMEFLNILEGHGFEVSKIEEYKESCDNDYDFCLINVKEYVDIYMFICEIGNNKLAWERVKGDNLNIGGYGLFY